MEKERINKSNVSTIIIGIILIVFAGLLIFLIVTKVNKPEKKETSKITPKIPSTSYKMSGNSLENFDLYFLNINNKNNNVIYSPLSIKYSLLMLSEGANGDTKTQIDNIVGEYKGNKYYNGNNISFANALFVNSSYNELIKDSYTKTLSNKYNAGVMYDSFLSPNYVNSWISDRTFGLINNMLEDVSNKNFLLINALAIDMEWNKKLQSVEEMFIVDYAHEDFSKWISSLDSGGLHELDFNNKKVVSTEIGAVINKYDIISEIGEEEIRKTVGDEYQKWLDGGAENACGFPADELDKNAYLDKYISEISDNYKSIDSSTDFEFYVDDNFKVFAKDLKTYNNVTLQYVGIMPKKTSLQDYIKTVKAEDISSLLTKLKKVEMDIFKDGVITEITGYIPLFKFDYSLNLMNDLKSLGVTDVFDPSKADLSNIADDNIFVDSASHKANIEFSNDGIKASAATEIGGAGAGDCGFDYFYEVPVEHIDLSFDNPYMFLIRNKDTGEVWFVGSVYEPNEWIEQQ